MEILNFKELRIEKRIENGIIGKVNDNKIILIFNESSVSEDIFDNLSSVKIFSENIINPPYYNVNIQINQRSYNIRLTYPAETKHIKKYDDRKFVSETYEEYLKTNKDIPEWVINIIEHKNETPVYESEKFLVVKDYKWDGKNVNNLYLTLFFKDYSLKSIREIKKEHILEATPVVKEVLEKFNLQIEDCLLYFHYKPSYYLLHMHIFSLKGVFTASQSVGRAILVQDVLKNLENDPLYYKNGKLFFID